MTANPSGGLVGIAKRLAAKAKGALRSSYENLGAALVGMFVIFVVGAAVLSIVESTISKSGVSTLTLSRLLLLGLGAIIAELMGIHRLVLSWHKAQPGQMAAWSAVWVIGLGFSVYSAVNSSAEFSARRANVQKTAFVTASNVSADLEAARSRVRSDEKSVNDLKAMTWQELPKVDGKPVMSADAARELIKAAEGNTRFFVDLTNRCTDAKGQQSRKFCKDLGDARAAEKDLMQRASWQTDIKAAEVQLTDSREKLALASAKVAKTDVQTSDTTPFVSLVAYFTGAEPEKVMWIETFQISFTNMLLVSLAGLVLGLHHVSESPRTKWFSGMGRFTSRLRSMLFGAPSANDQIAAKLARDGTVKFEQTLTDERQVNQFKAELNERLKQLGFTPERAAA